MAAAILASSSADHRSLSGWTLAALRTAAAKVDADADAAWASPRAAWADAAAAAAAQRSARAGARAAAARRAHAVEPRRGVPR
eukprot:4855852-Alexandrium_andersonii.AAC.1